MRFLQTGGSAFFTSYGAFEIPPYAHKKHYDITGALADDAKLSYNKTFSWTMAPDASNKAENVQ